MTEKSQSAASGKTADATKKTSFSLNRGPKVPSRERGGEYAVLAAGLVLFAVIAGAIFYQETVGRDNAANHQQALVVGDSLSFPVRSAEQDNDQAPTTVQESGVEAAADSDTGDVSADVADTGEVCVGCMSPQPLVLPPRPDESQLKIPGLEVVRGRWIAVLPDGVAEAIFGSHSFQIIYAGRSEDGFRRYARGYYSYDDATGIMSLKPAYKEPPPQPVPGVIFQVLTLRYFDVVVRSDSGGSLQYWTAPPEMLASLQIFPLLAFTGVQDNPYLVWEKAK